MHGSSIEKDEERSANVLERLIQAKSISRFESIKWFVRGTFYVSGFLWVALAVPLGLEGGNWDFVFDLLPVCLLLGFIWGAFMHVLVNLKLFRQTKTE
jgi:hypothetical protein